MCTPLRSSVYTHAPSMGSLKGSDHHDLRYDCIFKCAFNLEGAPWPTSCSVNN